MKCDECNGEVVEIKGELSCEECGMVSGEVYESGANEWEYDSKLGRKQRVKHADKELGSKIGHERMKGAAKLRRLATIFSLSPEQRLLKKAMFFINIASSEFQLSDCAKTDMKNYYTELRKKGILTSGMVMEERAGALVYIILKLMQDISFFWQIT